MTEQQYGRRAVEVGDTGKTVAENLARLRKARGYSTRQLSAALERAGRSISASGITRMEKADRHVTTDDLTALAVVLGVNPSALLLPLTDRPDTPVEVTGAGTVPAIAAWEWADGKTPLRYTPGRAAEDERWEYQLYGRPAWRRPVRLGGKHGNRDAQGLRAQMSMSGAGYGWDDEGKPVWIPAEEMERGDADEQGLD